MCARAKATQETRVTITDPLCINTKTRLCKTRKKKAEKRALLLLHWCPSSQNTRQLLAAHLHHCSNCRSNGQNKYYREGEYQMELHRDIFLLARVPCPVGFNHSRFCLCFSSIASTCPTVFDWIIGFHARAMRGAAAGTCFTFFLIWEDTGNTRSRSE